MINEFTFNSYYEKLINIQYNGESILAIVMPMNDGDITYCLYKYTIYFNENLDTDIDRKLKVTGVDEI